MRRLAVKTFCSMLLAAAVMLPEAAARAGSIEIWPSERRANNTLYAYGGEWNWMLIQIEAQDYCKHKVDFPEKFTEPTLLEVSLPAEAEFLGVNNNFRPNEVSMDFEVAPVDGGAYNRIFIPLHNDILNQRVIDNPWYYRVYVWFDSPEELDSEVSFRLVYGGEEMASGGSRLVSAGVIDPGRSLPERFGFYPYGSLSVVPRDDFDRMAGFYARFGITGIESHMRYGLPAEEPTNHHRLYDANRRHGVKNMANMSRFARTHAGSAYGGVRGPVMAAGGLVPAMDAAVEGLESEEARRAWRDARGQFDMAFWDWEPTGPHSWPGYDDEATIAAFAEKKGIAGELTPELLRTEHRLDYFRFRMEQIARPLYAMKRTINAFEPMHFRVETGAGARTNIDYDVFGHDFEAVSPMIYQARPLGYARNLTEMLANTGVPSKKFWPDMTIGVRRSGVYRESPGEFLLDTVVTAAAGCGSVSHWPGIFLTDASWMGIHEGLARIALVEEFYFDGAPSGAAAIEAIPYRTETVDLGHRTLEVRTPDWPSVLMSFVHGLGREHLVTLINYHPEEDAYVRVALPGTRSRYFVNPVDGAYQLFDDNGSALVRVGSGSPAMWIATSDRRRISGLEAVGTDSVKDGLESARKSFLADERAGEITLGTAGEITVEYALVEFAGEERVGLNVITPLQEVTFGHSGGRIYRWKPAGMESLAAKENFGRDGLGKDLLWLPETSRWSGDESRDYELVEVSNDGREARVVYEGEYRSGYPGVGIRKTYRVRPDSRKIDVEVVLRNNLVEPVELSYWSHNVFMARSAHFIGADTLHETPRGASTIFPAEGSPARLRRIMLMPDRIVAETGPVYAEFFPEENAGIIFRLPENFMNVYRWHNARTNRTGSEWMSVPVELLTGGEASFRFSMTAVPEASVESLRARFADSLPGETRNFLPFGFEPDGEGLNPGWRVAKSGEGAESATISVETAGQGGPVVRIDMPEEASVTLNTARRIRLDPAGNYMLVVQMKVEDMSAGRFRRPEGIMLYAYGTDGKHTWLAVWGEGDSGGWMTGILPFPSREELRANFASTNILLHCLNMTGTVSFRNPMVVPQPAGADIERSFELPDGSMFTGSRFQLRR